MLILNRKAGESFEIGGGIKVSVLAVEGRRVRLAIQAPPEIHIVRSELLEVMNVNRDSAQRLLKTDELVQVLHTAIGSGVDGVPGEDDACIGNCACKK